MTPKQMLKKTRVVVNSNDEPLMVIVNKELDNDNIDVAELRVLEKDEMLSMIFQLTKVVMKMQNSNCVAINDGVKELQLVLGDYHEHNKVEVK